MKPILSVIVPVYNVELYLERCIESIRSQTLIELEIILINDGSSDCSGDICNQYAKKDNRITVVHKEHGGVSSARNIGIDLATGDYIGFVDSDDRIDRQMYEKLHELCVQTNCDIAICQLGREINGNIINHDLKPYVIQMDHEESLRQLFKGVLYRFSLCNKLFHRECFENIQFPEGRIHEDLSTTYKLFVNSNKATYTNYMGYVYVWRENSILTSNFNKTRMDAFIGWSEILSFMSEQYAHLSKDFFSCFVFGCVDNVHYILKQVKKKEEKKKYLSSIQLLVRNYFKEIIRNNSVSLKYKYTLTLLNFDIRLLLLMNRSKR